MTMTVLTAVEGSVATVTLNRPEARNAISRKLRDDLASAFDLIASTAEIRAVVLTGAGDQAFCAGLDRTELMVTIAELYNDQPKLELDVATIVSRSPVPVIAAVNGVAMTGGLELMLACDFALCAEGARFADTHARLGLAPMWGMSVRLPRRVGIERAKQMCLTGDWIDAPRALAWGLVNEVVPATDLLRSAHAFAAGIAACDTDAVSFARKQLEEGVHGAVSGAIEHERLAAITFNKARSQSQDGGSR